ncbi:MAG: hypothetical protein ACLP5V_15825 [Candidatus Bathyarchaeia archaeon]
MSDETVTVTFETDRLEQLKKARELFASDTDNNISINDFLDMLIKTFMMYREKRGPTESSLLKKMTQT